MISLLISLLISLVVGAVCVVALREVRLSHEAGLRSVQDMHVQMSASRDTEIAAISAALSDAVRVVTAPTPSPVDYSQMPFAPVMPGSMARFDPEDYSDPTDEFIADPRPDVLSSQDLSSILNKMGIGRAE